LDEIDKLTEEGNIPASSFDNYFYANNSDDANSYLNILKKELQKKKINLFKFISQYEDRVFNDDDFISKNGFMDFILYTYDDTKGILSGDKLIDRDVDTYYYKYTYGFHNYYMGQKYILQSFNSLDEYFKKVSETIIMSCLYAMFGFNDIEEHKKLIKPYIIVKKHQKGYVVYADLQLIYSEITKSFNLSAMSVLYENYEIFIKIFREDLNDYIILKNEILAFFVNLPKSLNNKEFNEINKHFEFIHDVKKYNL
jgi:hypothetical protein